VTAIHLPASRTGRSVYLKLARTPGDYATVSVACSLNEDGLRVAVGACGPAPLRSPEAEVRWGAAILEGDRDALASLCETLAGLADPIDDVRGSSEYRLQLIPRMVAAAIEDAKGEAQ
jgi:carbon-monoxide dehydrogenase medium subunit